MKFSLDDISIIPARVSNISHRSECSPYNFDNMLPLFTAPMSSVIDDKNYQIFMDNKINTIIPRNISLDIRLNLMTKTFVAMGLDEFDTYINTTVVNTDIIKYICIDIANGHMKKLLDLCAKAKDIHGNSLILMTGNIANPATYADYAKVGIDFVRLSIGQGSACTTAANSATYYPQGSLIEETYEVKKFVEAHIKYANNNNVPSDYRSCPFIIADGGFNNFDKIIKALALGADYVMLGKLFAQCEEACGCIDDKGSRSYYGMSTRKAQQEISNLSKKTSEGIEFEVPVKYTLAQWCDNFISYLRTTMSYTDSKTLDDLKAAEICHMTPASRLSYYK